MAFFFKLKLLNGALAGRELMLPAGTFTLGAGDCDLSVSLEHGQSATLEVTEEQVSLVSHTPCWVQGRRSPPGLLPIGVAIDLAGVGFALGGVDEELKLSALPARRKPLQTLLPLLLLSVLAGVGLCWALYPAPAAEPPGPREWLPPLLKQQLPGVVATWRTDQPLLLAGRCQDSQRLAGLVQQLERAGVRLVQEVVCNDQLQASVMTLLRSYGYTDVDVTIDADGKASIDGQLVDNKQFDQLAQSLDQMPGLTGWHFSDRHADDLARMIERLQADGQLAGLSAVRSPHGWILSGQLTEKRVTELQPLLAALRTELQLMRPIRLVNVTQVVDSKDFLPAGIASLGGNQSAPYLELVNGMRLQVGSMVKKGMWIVDISPGGVSLSDTHQLVFVPLQA